MPFCNIQFFITVFAQENNTDMQICAVFEVGYKVIVRNEGKIMIKLNCNIRKGVIT